MTHSKVSVYDLVGKVKTAMATITGAIAKANETITEGAHEKFTLLIGWSELEGAAGSRTHMNTLGKGLQLRRMVVEITLLARQRSQIGEDWAAVANYADDILDKLEAQPAAAPFSLSGVHTFHWTARRGVIEYGSASYAGAIFTLEFLCH